MHRVRTLLIFLLLVAPIISRAEVLTAEALLGLKQVGTAVLSPNGNMIAYTIDIPRQANDEAGASYAELHVYFRESRESRGYITGKVKIGSPAWNPDSKTIACIMKRGDKAQPQVWTIRIDGGEAKQVTHAETGVLSVRWHPSGTMVGYIAEVPRSARTRALESKGYGFITYEENLRPRTLFVTDLGGEFIASVFKRTVARLGVKQRFAAADNIRATARLERFWKSLKQIAQIRLIPPLDLPDLEQRLSHALAYYAFQRPHSSLANRTPMQAFMGVDPRPLLPLPRGRKREPASPPPLQIGFVPSSCGDLGILMPAAA